MVLKKHHCAHQNFEGWAAEYPPAQERGSCQQILEKCFHFLYKLLDFKYFLLLHQCFLHIQRQLPLCEQQLVNVNMLKMLFKSKAEGLDTIN